MIPAMKFTLNAIKQRVDWECPILMNIYAVHAMSVITHQAYKE